MWLMQSPPIPGCLNVSELSIVSRKVGTLETGPILLKGERKYVVSCKVTTKELDFKPETL